MVQQVGKKIIILYYFINCDTKLLFAVIVSNTKFISKLGQGDAAYFTATEDSYLSDVSFYNTKLFLEKGIFNIDNMFFTGESSIIISDGFSLQNSIVYNTTQFNLLLQNNRPGLINNFTVVESSGSGAITASGRNETVIMNSKLSGHFTDLIKTTYGNVIVDSCSLGPNTGHGRVLNSVESKELTVRKSILFNTRLGVQISRTTKGILLSIIIMTTWITNLLLWIATFESSRIYNVSGTYLFEIQASQVYFSNCEVNLLAFNNK